VVLEGATAPPFRPVPPSFPVDVPPFAPPFRGGATGAICFDQWEPVSLDSPFFPGSRPGDLPLGSEQTRFLPGSGSGRKGNRPESNRSIQQNVLEPHSCAHHTAPTSKTNAAMITARVRSAKAQYAGRRVQNVQRKTVAGRARCVTRCANGEEHVVPLRVGKKLDAVPVRRRNLDGERKAPRPRPRRKPGWKRDDTTRRRVGIGATPIVSMRERNG